MYRISGDGYLLNILERIKNRDNIFRTFSKREVIFLFMLIVSTFLLYNKLNFTESRWTLHPDDHDVVVFDKVLLKTGKLWFQSPYNDIYNTNAFYPGIHDFKCDPSKGHKIKAAYSPGIYLLTAPGNLIGFRGPFVIVAMFGVIGLLFFYLMMRELFGTVAAMASSIFLGFSTAYIFWSNMLFSNIPALTFFLIGLYFLVKLTKKPYLRRYYILPVFFMVFTLLIRGDFIYPIGISIILVVVRYYRELRWRHIFETIILFAGIGATVALVNFVTSGSVLNINPKNFGFSSIFQFLIKYPLVGANITAMKKNVTMYIYQIAPALTVLGILGFLYCLKSDIRRNIFLWIFCLVGIFATYYYGKNAYYWGYGSAWLASSYVRYFLLSFMSLSVFAGIFVEELLNRISFKKLAVGVCALVLLVYIVVSLNTVANAEFGLNWVESWNESAKKVNYYFESVPKNSVVVDYTKDGFYQKMIISRTVFNPRILEKRDKIQRTVQILADLDRKGIPIYLITNPERNISNVEALSKEANFFELERVPYMIKFEVGGVDPIIYKLLFK